MRFIIRCVGYFRTSRNNYVSLSSTRDWRIFHENSVRMDCSRKYCEQGLNEKLQRIFDLKRTSVSNWIIETKVKTLCTLYAQLLKPQKSDFILILAKDYAINHDSVAKTSQAFQEVIKDNRCTLRITKQEEALKAALTPHYLWLFTHIGRLENGVKFLVDLRTDILDCLAEINHPSKNELQQLNSTLKELLSMWFSVGFLTLVRVTWKSPCELLQKISEYEAVHPMRSWTDLKRRVGAYRRCFVYMHNSMPGEPLVVLHTALADEICSSVSGIVTSRSRMQDNNQSMNTSLIPGDKEDVEKVKAAVFYSITSTQRGLQGIELGNYLIKRVVSELQREFPNVDQFSSLSPIPGFKIWLMDRIKAAQRNADFVFRNEEIVRLKELVGPDDEFWGNLRRILNTNSWIENKELIQILEVPLMRLCARYLFLEKRRGYALDSVGNFHLRNGAVLWRINWNADLSPRGLSNSCGIMVNYRYFLDETENNSRMYLEGKIIRVSDNIQQIAHSAITHSTFSSKM